MWNCLTADLGGKKQHVNYSHFLFFFFFLFFCEMQALLYLSFLYGIVGYITIPSNPFTKKSSRIETAIALQKE